MCLNDAIVVSLQRQVHNLITIKVDRFIIHNDYKTEKREVFSS